MSEETIGNQTYKNDGPIIVEKPFKLEIARSTKGPSYRLKVCENSLEETVRKALVAASVIEEALKDWPKPLSEINKIVGWLVEAWNPPKKAEGESEAKKTLSYEAVESLPWRQSENNPNYSWVYIDEAESSPTGLKLIEEVKKSEKGIFEFGEWVFKISGNSRFLGRLKKLQRQPEQPNFSEKI